MITSKDKAKIRDVIEKIVWRVNAMKDDPACYEYMMIDRALEIIDFYGYKLVKKDDSAD